MTGLAVFTADSQLNMIAQPDSPRGMSESKHKQIFVLFFSFFHVLRSCYIIFTSSILCGNDVYPHHPKTTILLGSYSGRASTDGALPTQTRGRPWTASSQPQSDCFLPGQGWERRWRRAWWAWRRTTSWLIFSTGSGSSPWRRSGESKIAKIVGKLGAYDPVDLTHYWSYLMVGAWFYFSSD